MKKFKKALCLLTASLLLFLSPVASFMDTTNMSQVEAAEVAIPAGISALDFLFNLFGATTVGKAALDKASTFKQYIDIITKLGYVGVAEILSNLTTGDSLTVTKDMTDATKAYLEQEIGNPASGQIQYKYDGYYYQTGNFDSIDTMALQTYTSKYQNYFFIGSKSVAYSDARWHAGCNADTYISNYGGGLTEKQYYIVIMLGSDNPVYYLVPYENTGKPYTTRAYNEQFLTLKLRSDDTIYLNTPYDSFYTLNKSWTDLLIAGSSDLILSTNLPVLTYDGTYSQFYSASPSLSELISGSKLHINIEQSKSMVSWGAYDESIIEKLIDKVISSKAITGLNSSVSDVITKNTVTDEATGDTTYADNISTIVENAVRKALDESDIDGWEVIDGGGGTEKPDPDDEEQTNYPWLPDLSNKIGTIEDAVNNGIKSVVEAIGSALSALLDVLGKILTAINTLDNTVTNAIKTGIETVVDNAQELWKANAPVLWEWFGKIGDYIQALPEQIAEAWTDFQPTLWKWLGDIKDVILEIPAAIGELVNPLWNTLWEWLARILSAITSLPQAIADLILSGLEKLFVPDLADAQAELDVIKGKFEWIGDLYTVFKTNLTTLSPDSEPPVIYIDFSKAESSKYVPVGKQLAIDFAWYAKYKPVGDKVVGAFMWIGYLWFMFKRLPDIISGSGAVASGSMRYDDAMERKNNKNKKGD